MRSLILILGLAIGCSTADVQMHTASLDTAPYSQFHTFAFAGEGRLKGYGSSSRAQHVIDVMQSAVGDTLGEKGYTPAPEASSDLLIVCSAGRREEESHLRLPWRMTAITGETYEDRDFTEGGVVVDVFDQSGGQVWHGGARGEINTEKPDDALVRKIVVKLMNEFPSRVPK